MITCDYRSPCGDACTAPATTRGCAEGRSDVHACDEHARVYAVGWPDATWRSIVEPTVRARINALDAWAEVLK